MELFINFTRRTEKENAALKDGLEGARKALLAIRGRICIHDIPKNTRGGVGGYCDQCPCSSIGNKNASGLTWEQSKLICPLKRYYSK